MRTNSYSVEVLVDGRTATEFYNGNAAQAATGTYIEGKEGRSFTIRVTNHTGRRILAVVSVDGLSVMDGSTASVSGKGYVIDAFGHVNIPGWRRTTREVARFEFTRAQSAYASRIGADTKNIGVVGVAVFPEYRRQPEPFIDRWFGDWGVIGSRGVAKGTPESARGGGGGQRYACAAGPSVGTGYGEATEHNVRDVDFRRESYTPSAVLSLYYESRDRLQEMGIYEVSGPQPFPDAQPRQEPVATPVATPAPPGWIHRRRVPWNAPWIRR